MCGRFYIDDDTAREIEKTIRKTDEKLRRERGDVRPADVATVITAAQSKLATAAQSSLTTAAQRWGFPGFGDRKLIINARAESVLEKNMFRESVLKRRILVPAAGFYEWNRKKEKAVFTARSKPILYLAGFYSHFEGEDRFVILTTEANASMRDVHDRMPLMFEGEEIEAWLRDDRRLEDMLHKVPQQLHKNMDYEQQTLNLMF